MKRMSKPLKVDSIECLLDEFNLAHESIPLAHALEDFDFEGYANSLRQEANQDKHKDSPHIQKSLNDLADMYDGLGEKVDDYLG